MREIVQPLARWLMLQRHHTHSQVTIPCLDLYPLIKLDVFRGQEYCRGQGINPGGIAYSSSFSSVKTSTPDLRTTGLPWCATRLAWKMGGCIQDPTRSIQYFCKSSFSLQLWKCESVRIFMTIDYAVLYKLTSCQSCPDGIFCSDGNVPCLCCLAQLPLAAYGLPTPKIWLV